MNTYTLKITDVQSKEIKKFFEKEKASFDVVQYSNWRAKTTDYQAIYYTSGKLLIQGKNVDQVAKAVNDLVGIETKEETGIVQIPDEKYIGTDESGKGDFFGPLVIAGVQADSNLKQKFLEWGVKDSKKLDDKKILQLANQIKANAVHSVVVITPVKYNELYAKFKNLNKLLAWGHARAIENILEKSDCKYALADKFGDESLIKNALMTKGREIILNQMVRAEADSAVAAASILARSEFVKRMQDMEHRYEMQFSKGVSENVVEQAKNFVKVYSKERLNEVAKLHFKTTNVIN